MVWHGGDNKQINRETRPFHMWSISWVTIWRI